MKANEAKTPHVSDRAPTLKTYRMVIEVQVENGVNESYPTLKNMRQYVSQTLGRNMGHQRDNGIPIKVKGLAVGKAERVA